MSKKQASVPRPVKRVEYRVEFHSNAAAKGWTDLLSTTRSATTDAWDRLTAAPLDETQRQYKLKADYARVSWQGVTYGRWQYKVSDGGRIWYFVVTPDPQGKCAGVVRLERCSTGHPKETDASASAG